MALQGMKQKAHSTLIPELLPKPPQPFHGITLDGQIKTPSLNGSSAQKLRLDVEREEHRGGNSWVHTTAKRWVLFFPLVSAFVFTRRGWRVGGGERWGLFLCNGLLFSEYNISVSCSEALDDIFKCFNKWPHFHRLRYTSMHGSYTSDGLHVDFRAIRS